MALSVIGAGFGRTGTLSLKVAIEKLGIGRCYHMFEVLERPDHAGMWHAIAFGQPPDWGRLFQDFQATVDWPACRYWRELAMHYPEAKVLLSVRDPQAWHRSMSETLFPAMQMKTREDVPEAVKLQLAMARKIALEDTFGGRVDQEHATAVFRRHIETVQATIEPRRLLVFEVSQGWGPLCRFLNVPEPNEPFPHLNETAAIREVIKQWRAE